jgi:chromosome segregation ATPase
MMAHHSTLSALCLVWAAVEQSVSLIQRVFRSWVLCQAAKARVRELRAGLRQAGIEAQKHLVVQTARADRLQRANTAARSQIEALERAASDAALSLRSQSNMITDLEAALRAERDRMVATVSALANMTASNASLNGKLQEALQREAALQAAKVVVETRYEAAASGKDDALLQLAEVQSVINQSQQQCRQLEHKVHKMRKEKK